MKVVDILDGQVDEAERKSIGGSVGKDEVMAIIKIIISKIIIILVIRSSTHVCETKKNINKYY